MIHFAGMEDWEAVYALICAMEQKVLDPGAFQEIYRAQQEDPHMRCLLYTDDSATLGCLNLRMEAQLHHAAQVAEIMEFAVQEGFRSKGIGAALFAAACGTAREAGCVQIEVCCNCLREGAQRFYVRQGMQAFHYKLSYNLTGQQPKDNRLGL